MHSDTCIYIWRTEDDFIIITVWVDDILLFTTSIELRDKARLDIGKEWEVTDLGEPTKIVGIEITKTPNSIAIWLKRYIESILLKEGLSRIDSVSMPLDLNIQIVPNPEGNEGSCSNSFARLLGEL